MDIQIGDTVEVLIPHWAQARAQHLQEDFGPFALGVVTDIIRGTSFCVRFDQNVNAGSPTHMWLEKDRLCLHKQ